MTKGVKKNYYKIKLQELSLKNGCAGEQSLDFEFENHDNLFEIIDRITSSDLFADKQQAIEFAVGLKLFSEVMLRNKAHPLFEDLKPGFGAFMKKLKQSTAVSEKVADQ